MNSATWDAEGTRNPGDISTVVTPDGDRILAYGDDDPTRRPIHGPFPGLRCRHRRPAGFRRPRRGSGSRRPLRVAAHRRPVGSPIPDPGRRLGVWPTAGGLLAYDLATGDILYEGPAGTPEASPSLDLMAVRCSARRVTILDISSDGPGRRSPPSPPTIGYGGSPSTRTVRNSPSGTPRPSTLSTPPPGWWPNR
jgi:hypothetical protein